MWHLPGDLGVLPYEVHCPPPDPDTTRGEARMIGALAKEKGWTRVIVVTSSYQLSRAGLLLGQCFDGELLSVPAQPQLSAFAWARRVGHEWARVDPRHGDRARLLIRVPRR